MLQWFTSCPPVDIFWQTAEWLFCLMSRPASAVVVHHKVSGSNISRTVWPRITKFCTDVLADLVYRHTGYDFTSYFHRHLSKLEKMAENAPPTALGQILVVPRFAWPNQLVGFLLWSNRRRDVIVCRKGVVPKHYHIKRTHDEHYYLSDRHHFSTIPELIYYHKLNSGGWSKLILGF